MQQIGLVGILRYKSPPKTKQNNNNNNKNRKKGKRKKDNARNLFCQQQNHVARDSFPHPEVSQCLSSCSISRTQGVPCHVLASEKKGGQVSVT